MRGEWKSGDDRSVREFAALRARPANQSGRYDKSCANIKCRINNEPDVPEQWLKIVDETATGTDGAERFVIETPRRWKCEIIGRAAAAATAESPRCRDRHVGNFIRCRALSTAGSCRYISKNNFI